MTFNNNNSMTSTNLLFLEIFTYLIYHLHHLILLIYQIVLINYLCISNLMLYLIIYKNLYYVHVKYNPYSIYLLNQPINTIFLKNKTI